MELDRYGAHANAHPIDTCLQLPGRTGLSSLTGDRTFECNIRCLSRPSISSLYYTAVYNVHQMALTRRLMLTTLAPSTVLQNTKCPR
jgi:hypothetical protein